VSELAIIHTGSYGYSVQVYPVPRSITAHGKPTGSQSAVVRLCFGCVKHRLRWNVDPILFVMRLLVQVISSSCL
jgi:hypothetical protein